MPYDYKNYIMNNAVYSAVDHLVQDENADLKISDEGGRKWTVVSNQKEILVKGGQANVLKIIGHFFHWVFKHFSSKEMDKFNNAMKKINDASERPRELAKATAAAAEKQFDAAATNKFAIELEAYKKIGQKRTELEGLRKEIKEATLVLEEDKKLIASFDGQEKMIQGKIDNLKKGLEPQFSTEVKNHIKEYERQSKELPELNKNLEVTKKLLEDKKKKGITSIHFETIGKTEEVLANKVVQAAENYEKVDTKLKLTEKIINEKLEKFNIKFPDSGLTSENYEKIFSKLITDETEYQTSFNNKTNTDREAANLAVQDRETKLEALNKRSKECEDEIRKLGGAVLKDVDEDKKGVKDAGDGPKSQAPIEDAGEVVAQKVEVFNLDSISTAERLGQELIVTPYPNVNKAVLEIKEKSGSIRLANVWARLLGNLCKKHNADIVKAVTYEHGNINIQLKTVPGRNAEEQYRMWVPTSKNENGVVEPVGGVIITLGSEIVLTPRNGERKLEVKKGFDNFVELPTWAKAIFFWTKKFGSGATKLMADDHDKIIMTVGPTNVIRLISHEKLDRNWRVRAEVLGPKESSEKHLTDHKDKNDFLSND